RSPAALREALIASNTAWATWFGSGNPPVEPAFDAEVLPGAVESGVDDAADEDPVAGPPDAGAGGPEPAAVEPTSGSDSCPSCGAPPIVELCRGPGRLIEAGGANVAASTGAKRAASGPPGPCATGSPLADLCAGRVARARPNSAQKTRPAAIRTLRCEAAVP